jgi:phosphomannomutase
MLQTNAVIGGEGNGGVMLPDIHIGRDAPVAAALVISLLARHEGTLSSLKASLPQWFIVKMKVNAAGINAEEVCILADSSLR